MKVVHRSDDGIELAAGLGRRIDAALLIATALLCGLGGAIATVVHRDPLWLLMVLIGLGFGWLMLSAARAASPARRIRLDAGSGTLSWTYRNGYRGEKTETVPLSRLAEIRVEFTSDHDWLSFIDILDGATIVTVPAARARALSVTLNRWLQVYRLRLPTQ